MAATSEELIKGFCGFIAKWAKDSKTGVDPFKMPDLVMGHVSPKTGQEEVLVGGIPVFRTWMESDGAHCRLVTNDWEQL